MFKIEKIDELSSRELDQLRIDALRSFGKGEMTGISNIPLYAAVLVILKFHLEHLEAAIWFGAIFIVLSILDVLFSYITYKKQRLTLNFRFVLYPTALLLGLTWAALFLYVIKYYGFDWHAIFIILILIGNVTISTLTFESDYVFNIVYAFSLSVIPMLIAAFMIPDGRHRWALICLTVSGGISFLYLIKRNYENYWNNVVKTQLYNKRNIELLETQKQLSESARQAGMAEVATSVLHNVGNLLNSVNIAAQLIEDTNYQMPVDKLEKIIDLFQNRPDQVNAFFDGDKKGEMLIDYLGEVRNIFLKQKDIVNENTKTLLNNIDHIKRVIHFQQNNLTDSKLIERFQVNNVLKSTIDIFMDSINKNSIKLTVDLSTKIPEIVRERNKLVQILINLLSNAVDSLLLVDTIKRELTIQSSLKNGEIIINVTDTGTGIPEGCLLKVFSFGFTTKPHGHGYGLHNSSIFAQELGGNLTCSSAGEGQGATFSLSLKS